VILAGGLYGEREPKTGHFGGGAQHSPAISQEELRMLTEQTVERLRRLRLNAIADAYFAQWREPSA